MDLGGAKLACHKSVSRFYEPACCKCKSVSRFHELLHHIYMVHVMYEC